MIGNQIKGKSFRGVLNYLAQKPGSKLISKNMGGDTPTTLSQEFGISRRLNPRLKKAVYHSSLSLPITERLKDNTWSLLAHDYLEGMGFKDSQYVVYRHHDRGHDHIHIVASRIKITDGKTVSDSWDYVRSEKLIRELEHKYKLTPTVSSKEKHRRQQTTGELRLIDRTGEASVKTKLHQIINAETSASITIPEFINALQDRGVNTAVAFTKTNKIKGISYELDGVAFSGTHLGKAYTFPGLQKYGQVRYDRDLHHQKLIAASKRCLRLASQSLASQNKEVGQQNHERSERVKQILARQEERSSIIAPILKDYINQVRKATIKVDGYHISWQEEKQTLYLYVEPETKPRLKIKYSNSEFKPIELDLIDPDKPLLTDADLNYWREFAVKLHRMRTQDSQRLESEGHMKKTKNKGRSL